MLITIYAHDNYKLKALRFLIKSGYPKKLALPKSTELVSIIKMTRTSITYVLFERSLTHIFQF